MLFFIHSVDKPDHAEVRARTRAAHLEYMKGLADKVLVAGPTLADEGDAMTGSVFIIEAEDRQAAEAFAEGDPYYQAGLFESVTIMPWKKVFFRSPDSPET